MFGKQAKILIFLFLVGFLFLYGTSFTLAALRDTDMDGLTDEAETQVYRTDLANYDTDDDTIADGQEVLDGTNPLDAGDSQLSQWGAESARLLPSTDPLAWYIGRASGILAFLLLTIVVINGLLMSTRLVARFVPPPLNYEMHRFFAWMSLITILGHILSFTFDPFIKLRWVEGLIPFQLDRTVVSALGFHLNWTVSLGIFALYGIVALILSSELRTKISLKAWRRLHYISFATYTLFLLHGILAGTDSKEWWMAWIYALSATLVGLLILIRIAKSLGKKPSPHPLVFPETREVPIPVPEPSQPLLRKIV